MALATITAVAPNKGSLGGGTLVTVTGTNLTDAVSAKFGGTVVAVVGTPTATTAKFRTPKKVAVGAVDVIVTNTSNGDSAASTGAFTYGAIPAFAQRGPSGELVAAKDVFSQGDSVASVVNPNVLFAYNAQVQTQGNLGGLQGSQPDYVGLQKAAVVFGHPESEALITP